MSTRRDGLARGHGGVPRQKEKKVRRTRGRIGERVKCRSRVVSAGNKSVVSANKKGERRGRSTLHRQTHSRWERGCARK
jgi:hypothetical protein